MINHIKPFIYSISIAIILSSCGEKKPAADAIFYNGVVYTVDDSFTVATAFAIKDGKILEIGTDEQILKYSADQVTDLKGAPVYPGFHDGHCHFFGYGLDLKKISLVGTTSFESILDTLLKYKGQRSSGWIFGRGWDQNDWEIKEYPDNAKLDSLFPNDPVFLLRIDGHAAIVNSKAIEMAGINSSTKVSGGVVEMKNGKPSGILVDAAVDLVQERIPKPDRSTSITALLAAQKNCFEVGLTSVTDAGLINGGLEISTIKLIDSLHQKGELKMRMNVMATISEINQYKGKDKKWSDRLYVSGFKVYGDGALGSRGAFLKKPYSDKPDHYGFLIHSSKKLDSLAKEIASIGYQMNTHCIGDAAHKLVLDIYKKHTAKLKDHRWRIEHAQVIDTMDFGMYENSGIIPSVQPTHATSDMYWAVTRLGKDRMPGAYAFAELLKRSGLIIGGSDFPVEHINPLFGFYAAVVRKDQKGFPENGFLPNQAISRKEALKSMTIWPAFGGFMDQYIGSLQKGKEADFVILEKDIMQIPEKELWNVKVMETYIGGKKVFGRDR
ncbi:MAG: amidohydrolase [Bacteroidota bacterium]|jgi:predicted amidohydrolase YtcJ